MTYRIEFTRSARKSFTSLPMAVAVRLDHQIMQLTDDPRPPGCKKLVGHEDRYRIRDGDDRVIYDIVDDQLIVTVVKVGHRSAIYGEYADDKTAGRTLIAIGKLMVNHVDAMF